MAKASKRRPRKKRSTPSPARAAAIIGTAALVVVLGIKLPGLIETPVAQRLLAVVGARSEREAAAAGLAATLDRIGVAAAEIQRQATLQVGSGQTGAESWVIEVPRRLSLVECNLGINRAAGGLGLRVRDAWEHRTVGRGEATSGDSWPAVTLSLAPAAGDNALERWLGNRGRPADLFGPLGARGQTGTEWFRLTFVRTPQPPDARLAVVIDDFGYQWSGDAPAFLQFPGPLTFAILPGYRNSRRLADAARERGYEVILHIPMEPEGYPRVQPGPEAILVDHRPAEIRARIRRALRSVGPVAGISNHTGSLATADQDIMRVVLEETRRLGLFFLDSHTTPRSVVASVARRTGTPCLTNRLFLDNQRSKEKIAERLEEAIDIALDTEQVVVIGHPYGETIAALTEALPRLEEQGVRLVSLSELIQEPAVL